MLTVNNPEYSEYRKKHKESENAFLSELDKKQIQLYEKSQDDFIDSQNALIEKAFKLGLKYAFEMFKDLKDIEFIKEF